MNQKVKQQRFLKYRYLLLLNILKKLRYGHLLGRGFVSGSGSDQKGADPTGSGSATQVNGFKKISLPIKKVFKIF
jgi:hypothetical protein